VIRRALTLLAAAAVLASLIIPSQRVAAAPSPGSLSVGVAGAGPSSQDFSGGPITGSADASGNAGPPPTCQAPTCESIPLTLSAPGGFPAKKITLTVTINFNAAATNPLGLTGLDVYILDSAGTTQLGADTLGSAPAVAVAPKLDPGSYIIEITGEAGAVSETYTGTAAASVGASSSFPLVRAATAPLRFAPSTIVSPSVLGGEPQMSFERPVPGALPGLDPKRGFVDWPVSSRTMIGTLWRTTDGGDSYRQVVDPTCAERQVPNCNTGGGGDTVNRVNNYDGTVLFGDQESLAAEALASSADHGDSFPATRQFAVTAAGTGVDRQWISSVDAPGFTAGPFDTTFNLEGLFSYHIPAAGEYVSGVDTSGIVHPAPAPVIPSVSQSGPSRVDVQAGSHGSGWFYQCYRDGNGFEVASVPLSQYQSPTAYHINNVTGDQPQVFPWIALDTQGNLYAVWVAPDGQLYYSYSLINDPANDPTLATPGVPASKWSPKQRINQPVHGSTVFPEIVAGDPGHLAVVYMATGDWTGVSDGAPQGATNPARWSTVAAISGNALSNAPTFRYGLVSHRYNHLGSICTSGTTCIASQGDRSLLDMIDVTIDADGRVAVVYSDNNNSFASAELASASALGSAGSPFIEVTKLSEGPSLFNGHGPFTYTYPTSYRSAPAGDATWPNTAAGKNIPALDITGSGVSMSGDQLVGRIDLGEAGAAAFTRDLAAYNSQNSGSTDPAATRLQYVLRWADGNDVYYMAAETDSTGTPTFYGGKVDGTSAVSNATSAVGIAYRPQSAYTVTGQVSGNTLLLQAKASDFHVTSGSTLISFAAYSLAGPSDAIVTGQSATSQIFTSMRAVNASPPMDAIVAAPTTGTGTGAGTPPGVVPGTSGSGGVTGPAATIGTPNTAAAAPSAVHATQLAGLTLVLLGVMSTLRRRRRARRAN
jgi:hypothetical protein